MTSITFDGDFLSEKSSEPVVRLQPERELCTCGRVVVKFDPVETEAHPERPRFEGQWRTLLYI